MKRDYRDCSYHPETGDVRRSTWDLVTYGLGLLTSIGLVTLAIMEVLR